jgi:hypothetical protein
MAYNMNYLLENIPLAFKLAYTAFALFIIPIYYKQWGPGNFLWFSDIALFGSVIALWVESSLLASMMAVGVLLPEIAWNIDYFGRLISGRKLFGLSDYMFNKEKSIFLRSLSLFHVPIPIVLVWMVLVYGYDEKAIYYQTLLAWIVLLASYFLTKPEENVNWVYGPGEKPQQKIHPVIYLLLIMLFFPLFIYLPTHLLLKWILG